MHSDYLFLLPGNTESDIGRYGGLVQQECGRKCIITQRSGTGSGKTSKPSLERSVIDSGDCSCGLSNKNGGTGEVFVYTYLFYTFVIMFIGQIWERCHNENT